MRYLVVARNPDEALASFRPFLASHSDGWFDAWHVPRAALTGPDFPNVYRRIWFACWRADDLRDDRRVVAVAE